MTLYEKAREVADDYSKKLLRKRWQSHLLAAKLLDLRDRNHWTQAEVATRAGISESAVRNYEQQKSTPKQGHLEALARAFGIRPEALRLYDIDSMPLNDMVQLGETYGLEPAYDERFAYLRPTNDIMSNALYKGPFSIVRSKKRSSIAIGMRSGRTSSMSNTPKGIFP